MGSNPTSGTPAQGRIDVPCGDPRKLVRYRSEMERTLAGLADSGDDRLVEIAGVTGDGPVSFRLREIGFCRGARVRFVRRAPLGDPAMYELHGATLSLRQSEARLILVRPDDS